MILQDWNFKVQFLYVVRFEQNTMIGLFCVKTVMRIKLLYRTRVLNQMPLLLISWTNELC